MGGSKWKKVTEEEYILIKALDPKKAMCRYGSIRGWEVWEWGYYVSTEESESI